MSTFSKAMGAISSFQSVMGLLSSSFAVDVVCIMDENGKQVFATARIMRAMVQDESELFQHPLETGNQITDFKIDKPKVIQLAVVIPSDGYSNVYSQLSKAKTDGLSFVVQTRAGTFPDMVIQALPHEEGAQWGDCLAMSLTLAEVQWYSSTVEMLPAKEVAVSSKSAAAGGTAKPDADTVKSGQQRTPDASNAKTAKASSVLYDWTH